MATRESSVKSRTVPSLKNTFTTSRVDDGIEIGTTAAVSSGGVRRDWVAESCIDVAAGRSSRTGAVPDALQGSQRTSTRAPQSGVAPTPTVTLHAAADVGGRTLSSGESEITRSSLCASVYRLPSLNSAIACTSPLAPS
eukprot:3560351-Prymnesium_polylepis.1